MLVSVWWVGQGLDQFGETGSVPAPDNHPRAPTRYRAARPVESLEPFRAAGSAIIAMSHGNITLPRTRTYGAAFGWRRADKARLEIVDG